MKQGSHSLLVAQGNDQLDPSIVPSCWKTVGIFNVSGHSICETGSASPCIEETVRAAWRTFWCCVNCKKAQRISSALRVAQLERCVLLVLAFRWSRWPYTTSTAQQLDRLQRRMLQIIFRPRMSASETPEQFRQRTAKFISSVQNSCIKWSIKCALAVCYWATHLLRNTNGGSWAARLLDVRSSSELTFRRSTNGHRPGTRQLPGFTSRRWTDGVQRAFDKLLEANQVSSRLWRDLDALGADPFASL